MNAKVLLDEIDRFLTPNPQVTSASGKQYRYEGKSSYKARTTEYSHLDGKDVALLKTHIQSTPVVKLFADILLAVYNTLRDAPDFIEENGGVNQAFQIMIDNNDLRDYPYLHRDESYYVSLVLKYIEQRV